MAQLAEFCLIQNYFYRYLTQFSYFKNILAIYVETTPRKNLLGKHQNTQTLSTIHAKQPNSKLQQAQPSLL